MVQNTEIRLECNAVRIGSYTTVPNGPLRVQADSTCTITFSLKGMLIMITTYQGLNLKYLLCLVDKKINLCLVFCNVIKCMYNKTNYIKY